MELFPCYYHIDALVEDKSPWESYSLTTVSFCGGFGYCGHLGGGFGYCADWKWTASCHTDWNN